MRKIVALIWILFLVPLVSAHAIEKGPVIKSTEDYNIQFSIEPKFPVTGKDTHLDFIIKGRDGSPLSGLNTQLELHIKEKTIDLDLNEEQKGHYNTEYNFDGAGNYELHLIIDNKELETGFDLEIDSFGLSGLLRSGTILTLLLIFIGLMHRDYRKRKNG